MTTVVAVTAALLCSIGTYLVLQRKLSRIIIGVGLLGHGANLLLVTSGRSAGRRDHRHRARRARSATRWPRRSSSPPSSSRSAATAFLLALAYRSWLLSSDDEVVDDVEDRVVAAGGFDDREVTDEEQQAIDAGKDRHAEDTT